MIVRFAATVEPETFEAHNRMQPGKICDHKDITKSFEFDWGQNILPQKGDNISLDEYIETIDPNIETNWASLYYGIFWYIDSIIWEYHKVDKKMYPVYYLTDVEHKDL